MSEEYSFVEVLMIQYEPGQTEYQDFLENKIHCFDVPWEEATEEIKEVVEARKQREQDEEKARNEGRSVWGALSLSYEPDTLITKPLTAFIFRCFGQSLDREYSSGIEWEVYSMDTAYVFKGWLDDLKKIGQEILADKKAMGHPNAGNTVRFITLWSYSSWEDSYNHEWDSEWELLGLVDARKIYAMLKADQKEEVVF